MQVFLKRLTANELGETGANTRGEIYIPRSYVSFFPDPSGGRNPTAIVPFEWIEDGSIRGSTVRLTVYGNKNEAHLHRVPDAALGTAQSGDILRIDHNGDLFQSTIIAVSSRLYGNAVRLLDKNAACITTTDELDPPPPPPPPPTIETRHPLLEGPPVWASGWGEDEDFGPFVEIRIGQVKQRLRWIPKGSFLMGSPEKPKKEPGRNDNEGPQHAVTISNGFWLFDTPVTQELYEAVTGENPSRFVSPKRPVEQVGWEESRSFLEKLNDRVPGLEAGLPTEAEWEYACRAGTTDALYTGAIDIIEYRNAPALDPIAWYGGNCGVDFDLDDGADAKWGKQQYDFEQGGTREVGKKLANPWGLYDMLGNVYEWCDDGLRDYSETAERDPRGPSEASALRVIRGGSWYSLALLVRAAYRRGYSPEFRYYSLGFRCRVP
ncbi:MAG: SUMF1/EgtB/PvdO family nonheme iron enzyme [Rhodopirellula sp.]|nr:SUMF1/EgtB/PvdO family nonheme iron enzyme [Rhodopirellula sp.]